MKKFIHLSRLCLCLFIAGACKEDQFGPKGNDSEVPGPVRDVAVKNIAGGATLSYQLPNDQNLLYVKAVYEMQGKTVESKASYLTNSMTIEGFGDENPRDVTLYAVSRSEKASEPVTVQIKPLPAPVYKVLNSLDIKETFGGVSISFTNQDASAGNVNSNIVLGTLIWHENTKEWEEIDRHYSGLSQESYAVRGLEPVAYKFGFYIRDRWSNSTDTIEKELTPIYEEQLDKKLWRDVRKRYAVPQVGILPFSGNPMLEGVDYSGAYPITNLWDDNTGTFFHTKQNYEMPIWVPIDLGQNVKLSRYKIWQRYVASSYFSHGNPHEWEIWGTNTPENVDSWVLLTHEVMIKPSGLPVGQNTTDDISTGQAGQEYDFPLDAPQVRYIAWKHVDNWASIGGEVGFFHMSELTIWGQLNNPNIE